MHPHAKSHTKGDLHLRDTAPKNTLLEVEEEEEEDNNGRFWSYSKIYKKNR